MLLGGALPPEPVLAADLEVEVGAVEVGGRGVPTEEAAHAGVVDLDHLLVLLTQVGEAVVELVERESRLDALHLRQHVVEGPRLRAGRHRPGEDQAGEQVREREAEAARDLQEGEVAPDAERVVYGLEGEVAEVPLGGGVRYLADPPPLPLGPAPVESTSDLRCAIGSAIPDSLSSCS